MLASDFSFDLPPELIAQTPASPRDSARLLRLQRASGNLEHLRFDALAEILRPDDLLVLNDTRVLRARLRGWKIGEQGERGARVEALLLRERETNLWEALLRPSARLRVGSTLRFCSPDEQLSLDARPVERTDGGWIIRFDSRGDVREFLDQLGEVPLPPYIAPPKEDAKSDYQTVYARADHELESAAAPTAGLHFTPRVLQALGERGIRCAHVTLGIGIGTFRPIQTETIEEHAMHGENWEISAHAARMINAQKRRGARVVAIGTTATRVLESAVDENGTVAAGNGRTEIYIRPGHRFRVVDAMLTNFHLPRSSLLVMIAAFAQHGMQGADAMAGLEQIRYAYSAAIAARYRFFSFGDAMLIE